VNVLGWVEQLDDGRWRAFESEGSGGRRLRANAIRRTRTEARNAAKAKLERKHRESMLEPHTQTVGAYLKRWIAHERTQERSAHSVDSDESVVRQIPKAISATKLADVRPLQWQEWFDQETALSPNTIRKRHKRLRAAFAKAVAWRLLTDNPLDAVTPPKPRKTHMRALSEPETVVMLAVVKGTRFAAPALVAVTTGMRAGELLRLTWADVDLDGAVLQVRRTKGSAKHSPITLMAATVSALRAHRKAQAAERLAEERWHDRDLVFPARDGRSWQQSTFSGGWKRLGTGVRFHDLRHTHATQLLRAGVRLDAVSKRLGHASSAITAEVYSHVLADDDALAVERLETSLGGLLADDTGTGVGTSGAD
jgi:integrase